MSVVDLIERKRNGGRLAADELTAMMRDYAAGAIPDYQMSAFAMAVYFRGMDDAETEALTTAMLESGRTLELGHLGVPRVDKHSTGGVGDKVSLILAPLVACCGIAVPMMSGRGLGHTGGTLDKLESIPGFRTRLSLEETAAQLERLGVAMIGQTAEIAPADRKFYALRDATATVEAIPLIAASIMSKKLAEGLTGLVLDVKTGAGAFMTRLEDSLRLAQTMIALGERRGCPTVALLTEMDAPLGDACGNALEVEESVECLRGRGPADLREVTLALAVEMLLVGGVSREAAEARARATQALDSGAALAKFRALVAAQGGDPRVADDPKAVLPQAPVQVALAAPQAGVVQRVEPRAVGRAIIGLGGGRTKVEDAVDPAVGVVLHVKPGARVAAGQPLATIHARDAAACRAAEALLREAVRLGDGAVAARPLISHRVTARGVEALA
jgi:pyrimidine-nucleoside phosphorylase